uniref:Uncharacterized protein n=1 Tax=mine drainage metagenome TaxID=410659 RepID=E6QWS6_9ZZZZ
MHQQRNKINELFDPHPRPLSVFGNPFWRKAREYFFEDFVTYFHAAQYMKGRFRAQGAIDVRRRT